MNRKHLKLMSSDGGGFDAKAVLKALDDRIQEEAIDEEELNEHAKATCNSDPSSIAFVSQASSIVH